MSKMLLISQSFFNLDKHILEGFKEKFDEVDFYDERISNNKIMKVVLRMFPRLVERPNRRYYEAIYDDILRNDYDFILVVKAEIVPVWFLKKIRNLDVKMALYMYDPINNYPGIMEKTKFFDQCFTFDSEDALKYGWNHRALFFPPSIDLDKASAESNKYTGSFIGTLHSDRSKVISAILEKFPQEIYEKTIVYYYIPLLPMFLIGKYVQKLYQNLRVKDVHTTPLNAEQTMDIMKNSDFIIDIHHDTQSGLTTRTMEALGLHKKIITTNPFIRTYDFYNENNILVVDKYNIQIDANWFNTRYDDRISYDRDKYSISGFVNEIYNKTIGG